MRGRGKKMRTNAGLRKKEVRDAKGDAGAMKCLLGPSPSSPCWILQGLSSPAPTPQRSVGAFGQCALPMVTGADMSLGPGHHGSQSWSWGESFPEIHSKLLEKRNDLSPWFTNFSDSSCEQPYSLPSGEHPFVLGKKEPGINKRLTGGTGKRQESC